MIQLTVDNSACSISGLTVPQFQDLRDLMSYKITQQQNRFVKGYHVQKKYLISKRGDFPSGLLSVAEKYLKSIPHTVKDKRVAPHGRRGMFKLNLGMVPYPEQLEVAKTGARLHRGTCSLPTGSGKSVCIALLINELQVRTLVIVPNLELKRQLTESFTAFFGDMTNIAVENIDSPRLQTLKDFDCLIIDEAHRAASKTYRKLNQRAWAGMYFRFYFTATPFRAKEEEQILMESVTGQVIYVMTYKEAVSKGYIVPIEVYFYEVPRLKMKGNAKSWSSVYSELIVNNEPRNKLLAYLINSLFQSKQSSLCLVKEIKHGETLKNLTGAAFANGQDGDCSELISWFCKGKLTSLVATTGVFAEGVDSKSAEWVLLACGGKSKVQLTQMIGRVLRRYPGKESGKVIMFLDKSQKWLKAHFDECSRYIIDEYGVTPIELPLPDNFMETAAA